MLPLASVIDRPRSFMTLTVFSHESRFEIAMTNYSCDIWITECTYKREKISVSLQFSIPERGEEAWLVLVFFCHADYYFSFEIEFLFENVAVYQQKWLEGHAALPPPPNHNSKVQAFIRRFQSVIWEMPHLKTNDHSNYTLCSRVKTLLFWKTRLWVDDLCGASYQHLKGPQLQTRLTIYAFDERTRPHENAF